MNKISNFLINSLRIVTLIMVAILVVSSIGYMYKISEDNISNTFFVFEVIALIIGSVTIFSKIRHKYKIGILLLLALFLRIIWIFSVNTMPISDFNSMYQDAKTLLTGDMSVLKGYNYLARFPHLIPMTFYMLLIIKIFPVHNLLVLKIFNALLGVLSAFLLYKLADNFIKSEKNKLLVLLLSAIFPPFITYTSVLCTENIAIPLYLATLIMFYKAQKSTTGQAKGFIITGILLALSDLFRGVAIVFLIAFVIYILLCMEKKKVTNIGSIVLGYIILTIAISGFLLKVDLLERPLWDGAEPSAITLLLKGTNFEHNGMWNIDDANFVEKHLRDENLTELCLEEIKTRLSSKTPKELFLFYGKKFLSQWGTGDCSGTYWAYAGANIPMNSILPPVFQLIYIFVLFFAFISLFQNKNKALLNIILFGFFLLFILIETQARYSFVVSWIFIIFASQGIEIAVDFLKKGKNKWLKN